MADPTRPPRRDVRFIRIYRVADQKDPRQNIAFLDALLLDSLGDGRPKGSGRGQRRRRSQKHGDRLPGDPDHNLWNNNGTWFVVYTIHPTRVTKERICQSLQTRCLKTARLRRDGIFARRRREGTPVRSSPRRERRAPADPARPGPDLATKR